MRLMMSMTMMTSAACWCCCSYSCCWLCLTTVRVRAVVFRWAAWGQYDVGWCFLLLVVWSVWWWLELVNTSSFVRSVIVFLSLFCVILFFLDFKWFYLSFLFWCFIIDKRFVSIVTYISNLSFKAFYWFISNWKGEEIKLLKLAFLKNSMCFRISFSLKPKPTELLINFYFIQYYSSEKDTFLYNFFLSGSIINYK